jgi:glycerophosphoryl diester phosphodiesterase
MKIFAHRGASDIAPENTLAAFNAGWQTNCDGAECDIHLSRDGQIVVIHDSTTKRTCGTDLAVKDSDWAQLKSLDAGSWKASDFAGEHIPLLQDVLARIPDGRIMLIEVKCGHEAIPPLKTLLGGIKKEMAVIGFDLASMQEAKHAMPNRPVYWLVAPKRDEKTGLNLPYDPAIVNTAINAGLDGLNLHFSAISPVFAKHVKTAGFKLYAWTVDDLDEAKRLESMGVDGITTNRPAFMMKAMGRG